MAPHWKLHTLEPDYEILVLLQVVSLHWNSCTPNPPVCFYKPSFLDWKHCDENHKIQRFSFVKTSLSGRVGRGSDGPWGVRKWATSSSWVSSISDDCRLRLVPWSGPWFFLRMELRDSSVILWIWTFLCVGKRWPETGRWTRTGASCHITQQEATLTKTELRLNYCVCY